MKSKRIKAAVIIVLALALALAAVITVAFVNNRKLNDADISVLLSYNGIGTDGIGMSGIRDVPKGYRVVKVNCKIINNSVYELHGLQTKPFESSDIRYIDYCTDFEPSYPIEPKSNTDGIMYVFVSENISENKIPDILKAQKITFVCGVTDSYSKEIVCEWTDNNSMSQKP